jgi:hypothetical protein
MMAPLVIERDLEIPGFAPTDDSGWTKIAALARTVA